jgi:hypothetical protein
MTVESFCFCTFLIPLVALAFETISSVGIADFSP